MNHTSDAAILKVLKRFEKQSVKGMVNRIGNGEEYEIRNRLLRLTKEKILKKQKLSRRVVFSRTRLYQRDLHLGEEKKSNLPSSGKFRKKTFP